MMPAKIRSRFLDLAVGDPAGRDQIYVRFIFTTHC